VVALAVARYGYAVNYRSYNYDINPEAEKSAVLDAIPRQQPVMK
jgi:hypothetical protein